MSRILHHVKYLNPWMRSSKESSMRHWTSGRKAETALDSVSVPVSVCPAVIWLTKDTTFLEQCIFLKINKKLLDWRCEEGVAQVLVCDPVYICYNHNGDSHWPSPQLIFNVEFNYFFQDRVLNIPFLQQIAVLKFKWKCCLLIYVWFFFFFCTALATGAFWPLTRHFLNYLGKRTKDFCPE